MQTFDDLWRRDARGCQKPAEVPVVRDSGRALSNFEMNNFPMFIGITYVV